MKTNRPTIVDRAEGLFFAVLLLGAAPAATIAVATLLEPHAPGIVRYPLGLVSGIFAMFLVVAIGLAFDSPFDYIRRWIARNQPPPDAAQACEDCSCRSDVLGGAVSPKKLEEIRSSCPAIQVFVPNTRWTEFQEWHRTPSDSGHKSVILLARIIHQN